MKIAKDLQNWKSWIRFFKMVLFLIPRLSTLSCSLKGRTLEKWQSETMRPTNLWKWWVLTSAELKSKMKKVKWVVYHPGSDKKKGEMHYKHWLAITYDWNMCIFSILLVSSLPVSQSVGRFIEWKLTCLLKVKERRDLENKYCWKHIFTILNFRFIYHK